MAYTPRTFRKGNRIEVSNSHREETALRWDGWVPDDGLPYTPPPAFSAAQEETLRATFDARQPGLAKLFAGLAARQALPCRVAFAGSSTTQGSNATAAANRYVNLLVAALQAAYPSGTGVEPAVITDNSANFGTLSTAPGVHGYNAGEGGTHSGNYLTSAEIARIAAINPRAVIHMVGANDYGMNITLSDFRANVTAKIAELKAGIAGPCVHVLIHSYPRQDVPAPANSWAAYGQVLRELAAADPDNLVFLDLTEEYAKVGIPGSDPLNLLDTDNLHQTNAGHAYMAAMIARWLRLPPAPLAGTTATLVRSRLTSDAFSGADGANIIGRSADAALGGAARTWAGTSVNGIATSAGSMVRGAGTQNFFAGLPEGAANVEVGVTVTALPAGGSIFLDLHRQSNDAFQQPDGYRLAIQAGGWVQVMKRVSTVTTTLGEPGFSAVIGDRLTFAYHKGVLSVRRNGVLVWSGNDTSITAPGFTGVAGGLGVTGFGVDDFTLDALTA